jgi:hypothetical protein
LTPNGKRFSRAEQAAQSHFVAEYFFIMIIPLSFGGAAREARLAA